MVSGGVVDLRSDNTSGVAPEIMSAIAAANVGRATSYGGDEITERAQDLVREVFEHRSARVFPVTTGTAANALALSAASPPWGAVLCHADSHIVTAEGGAVSLLGGGVVTRSVGDVAGRLDPEALVQALEATIWGDPHVSQPAVLSLTVPSEGGVAYSPAQVAELSSIARAYSLRVHVDGARLANALVAVDATPADLTWRAGVDVLSLGATKNGALACEAVVTFDDRMADELVYRTQRAGHVPSKMRFVSAQLEAYLTDDLWLRLARRSNERMVELVDAVQPLARYGVRIVGEPSVNLLFLEVPEGVAEALAAADVLFQRGPDGQVRLVTSWQTTSEDVTTAVDQLAKAVR